MSDAAVKESKADKLKKLASKRLPAALHQIALVGNLAAYDPTPDQVEKILYALRSAIKRVEERLRGPSLKHEPETFEL